MRRWLRAQRFRKTIHASLRNLPSRRAVSNRPEDSRSVPQDAHGPPYPPYRYLADRDATRTGFMDTKWYAEQLAKLAEHSHHMLKRRELNERAVKVVIALSLAGGALIFWNWKRVKSDLAKESADLVKETIESPELQMTASLFSKELLHSLLTDENIQNTVSVWVMNLLRSLQTEIGALVVKILQQEQVLKQVRLLGDDLVAHLAKSVEIQKLVSHLLLQAIWLPIAQESIAQWVASPTIVNGLKDLIVRTLDTEEVQDKVTEKVRILGDDLVAHLSSSETIQQQVAHLLLQAIWLPSAQESVANWVVSPTIVNSTQVLVKNVLASEEVRTNASEMLAILLKELLSNEATQIQLSDTLRTALSDSSVLEAARDAAWSIVNPFWSHQKKLLPADMVKLLRNLPLSESEKLAVADLAMHAALPATLHALADADLGADPDCPPALLTASLKHVPSHDLIRALVANNQLAVLPSGEKQSLLEHMLEIVPAHVAHKHVGKVLAAAATASSRDDGTHADGEGMPSSTAFFETLPTAECIRRLNSAVNEGELSVSDIDMLAQLACTADPTHTIKRLQTCVLAQKAKNAFAVGALQSAPVETLEHLMTTPLLDEERVLLARAALHAALGETLDSVADVDERMQARLAHAAVRAARKETVRALEAEERDFSEREKALLVDLVVRVAPDVVALKRPRLQAPWDTPTERMQENNAADGKVSSDAVGNASTGEREVRELEKRFEVRLRKRLLSQQQDEGDLVHQEQKVASPVFAAEGTMVRALDQRLQKSMAPQRDEKHDAGSLQGDPKQHRAQSTSKMARREFTLGGSSSSSSVISGTTPESVNGCRESLPTGCAPAPSQSEKQPERGAERKAEADFLTDMESRAALWQSGMPSVSEAFLGSSAALRVAFANAVRHFRREASDEHVCNLAESSQSGNDRHSPHVAQEDSQKSRDPEVTRNDSDDWRHPKAALEETDNRGYSDVAQANTDRNRHSEVAQEDSEDRRSPHMVPQETNDMRSPQAAQQSAEDEQDLEEGCQNAEDRRYPAGAHQGNTSTQCPDITPGHTLERRNSDVVQGDAQDTRDRHSAEVITEDKRDSDVAQRDAQDTRDPHSAEVITEEKRDFDVAKEYKGNPAFVHRDSERRNDTQGNLVDERDCKVD